MHRSKSAGFIRVKVNFEQGLSTGNIIKFQTEKTKQLFQELSIHHTLTENICAHSKSMENFISSVEDLIQSHPLNIDISKWNQIRSDL